MSSYINKTIDLSSSGEKIIPLNGRWTEGNYSVVSTFAGAGTVSVEGTLSRINQGETPVWFDITNLTAVTSDSAENITNTPFEAFRVTGTGMSGGGAQVQIMSAGC